MHLASILNQGYIARNRARIQLKVSLRVQPYHAEGYMVICQTRHQCAREGYLLCSKPHCYCGAESGQNPILLNLVQCSFLSIETPPQTRSPALLKYWFTHTARDGLRSTDLLFANMSSPNLETLPESTLLEKKKLHRDSTYKHCVPSTGRKSPVPAALKSYDILQPPEEVDSSSHVLQMGGEEVTEDE